MRVMNVVEKKAFPQNFCVGDRIQTFFNQKELQIKMSSLLNVFNSSRKPEEFRLKDIEVLVDSEEQNWFKRAHVGTFLGIAHIITSTAKLAEDLGISFRLKGGSVAWTPLGKTLRIMISR